MHTLLCVKWYVITVIVSAMLLSFPDNVKAENVISDENQHVVVAGDNLVKISNRYGVSIGAIALSNGLTSTKIFVGQQLVIPDHDAPVNPVLVDRNWNAPITYVVRAGDTLGKIAQHLTEDLEKNTVSFRNNYDETEREPTVLPSQYPNIIQRYWRSEGFRETHLLDLPRFSGFVSPR